jgi:DUF4097 and DUF4098 domain-containing protein YvlB
MLALTMVVLGALSAQSQDFTWSGAIPSGKWLVVKNISGDIKVVPTSGNQATVTAVKRPGRHGDPDDVVVRQVNTDEGIEICVLYPGSDDNDDDCDWDGKRRHHHNGSNWDNNDTQVHFTVKVPANTNLRVGTVSGDVNGSGIRGETEARSVSGDVILHDVTGKVVEAVTVSGNVELTQVNADEVVAETVSGNVDFSGEIRKGGDYDMKTLSGDVIMRIPKNAGAQVSGATFSGDFHTSFPITTKATSHYTKRSRLDGTIGDGSARIRVESFSGDVELREIGER